MIVVADAGPLHHVVLIGAVDVLQVLYGCVLVPEVAPCLLRIRCTSYGQLGATVFTLLINN